MAATSERLLGNISQLNASLSEDLASGTSLIGRWTAGRIVGLLASPLQQSAVHMAVGVSALPAGVATPFHEHEAEELAIVISGSGVIDIGAETIAVQAGDVVLTPPRAVHRTGAAKDALTVLWIYAPSGSELRWLAGLDEEVPV